MDGPIWSIATPRQAWPRSSFSMAKRRSAAASSPSSPPRPNEIQRTIPERDEARRLLDEVALSGIAKVKVHGWGSAQAPIRVLSEHLYRWPAEARFPEGTRVRTLVLWRREPPHLADILVGKGSADFRWRRDGPLMGWTGCFPHLSYPLPASGPAGRRRSTRS